MKLYSVCAESCGYDEYDEFIIWAKDAAEALELAIKASSFSASYKSNFDEGAMVTVVTKPKVSGVLMGSFNAG